MVRRQPPRENPLKVLFDYLDDTVLGDPKKLAEMVKRQRRILQSAYHPDSNLNGPFSNDEAEARSKTINASNELDWLTDALSIATGHKPESYDGETGDVTRVLNVWIDDYRRNRANSGELTKKYETALGQVSSLTEQLRQSQRRVMDLEERLRSARTTTSRGTTRSGFTQTSTGTGADISDKIREYLASAETDVTSSYGSDEDRYLRLSRNVEKAREVAREHGVAFDRLFGPDVTRIVGKYLGGLLASAEADVTSSYGSDEDKYEKMSGRIAKAKQVAREQVIVFDRLFGQDVTRIVHKHLESLLTSAEIAATSSYGSDEDKYEKMSGRIAKAKQVAREQVIAFDRLFGQEVTEIVGKYVHNVLTNARSYMTNLNDVSFSLRIDNALKAATGFGETR